MYHLITGLYSEWAKKPQFNVLVLGTSGAGKTALLDQVRAWHTRTSARPLSRIAPTVGQNVLDLTLKRTILHFWDLGGEKSLRRIWPQYFDQAQALVWVMDICDWMDEEEARVSLAFLDEEEHDTNGDDEGGKALKRETRAMRQEDTWNALASLRSHSRIRALPLLIVLTKTDRVSPNIISGVQDRIKSVLSERLVGLEEAEESDLRDEMENIEGLASPKRGSGAWEDWDAIACSAQDATGLQRLLEWLDTRAQRNIR